MAKKATAKPKAEAAEDTRQNRNDRPDDPAYQMPARASEEELALLGQPIDDRLAALLKDHQEMGVR